jgi:hypothetical protein
MVVAPRMSGSNAGMSGGGGDAGLPTTFSSTHLPCRMGEVVVPLAVTFKMAACVITPPRRVPAGARSQDRPWRGTHNLILAESEYLQGCVSSPSRSNHQKQNRL